MFEYNPEDVQDEKTFDPWEKGIYECEIIEADKINLPLFELGIYGNSRGKRVSW